MRVMSDKQRRAVQALRKLANGDAELVSRALRYSPDGSKSSLKDTADFIRKEINKK